MTKTQISETNQLGSINWLQAITEVVLILVGIGLAVAADSWMDNRRELQEERQYLIAIREDLEKTKDELERYIRLTEESYELTLRFIQVLQGPSNAVTEEELLELFSDPFVVDWPSGVFGTYQDMVSSGDLRLIRNAEIRTALAKFVDDWSSDLWMPIQESFQQWNQLQVPYMVANLNVTTIQLRDYRGDTLPRDFKYKSIDRDKVWSQEFENILAIAAISDVDQIRNTQQLVDDAISILALIDKEFSRLAH